MTVAATTTKLTEAQRNEPHRKAARHWCIGAVGFMVAAEGLYRLHREGKELFWPAFYVNIGFGYELSLKAFLALRHWSDDQLKTQFGHDLEKLLAQTVALGYSPPPEAANMIAIIGPRHRNYSYRYLRDEPYEEPGTPTEVMAVARSHMAALKRQLPLDDLG